MALHERTGGGKIFLPVSCGRFKLKEGDTVRLLEGVDGILDHFTIDIDPGDGGQIKPKEVLKIELRDGDETYVVKATYPSTFTWMFASHLANLEAGDHIKLRTWAGTDVEKVSLCMIDWVNPETGAWEKVERTPYPVDDIDAKLDQAHSDITEHPAFVVTEYEKPAPQQTRRNSAPRPHNVERMAQARASREAQAPSTVRGRRDAAPSADEYDPFSDE